MNRRVVAVVDDLMFASKIRATAEHLGIDVRFARNADAAVEIVRAEEPSLIIVDLHSQRCDPFALAETLHADEALHTAPLVGFFSHVQTDLMRRAERAGFDQVLPRSAFTKNLPKILQGEDY